MNINIITLFPDVITPFFEVLPYKRALEKGVISINLYNLRDFALDSYGTVDDKPYGGGKGMILMVEPIFNALESIKKDYGDQRVILLSPRGKKYTQKKSLELTTEKNITIICGRYEGVDHRVEEFLADDVISIGDYVLSGGEVPALAIIESITRLLPSVLEKEAITKESFSNGNIEHPQYTRPENFNNWKVPEVLLSGHHKNIETWKKKHSSSVSDINY